MRGVFFWEAGGLVLDKANPYGGLLAQAMREVGVELEAGYPDTLTEEWLCQNQGRIDLLHLNWPNYMYDDPDLNDRLARCTELISNLALARLLGYRIVWTVHNLYPHESISRDLDRLAQVALTHLANAVIVHCKRARELVRTHFHRTEGVFVIPHGNFIEPYPNNISREDARQRLGLRRRRFRLLQLRQCAPLQRDRAIAGSLRRSAGDASAPLARRQVLHRVRQAGGRIDIGRR